MKNFRERGKFSRKNILDLAVVGFVGCCYFFLAESPLLKVPKIIETFGQEEVIPSSVEATLLVQTCKVEVWFRV